MAHKKEVAAEVYYAKEMLGLDVEREFCKGIVRWCGHICRHQSSQIFQLLSIQRDDWIQSLRAAHSSMRPQTRAEAGVVYRWSEGWFDLMEASFGFTFLQSDKPEIDRRADFLLSWIRPSSVGNMPIEDASEVLVIA